MLQYFLPLLMVVNGLMFGAHDEFHGAEIDKFAPGMIYATNIQWSEIETSPGVYDWSSVDGILAVDPGRYKIVITILTTPEFYRLYPGIVSSQPKPENYKDFVKFAFALDDRYHPFAIELGREPDVSPFEVAPDHWFYGSWDSGISYREFVDYVALRVHSLHYGTEIWTGGLMLETAGQYQFARDMLAGGEILADRVAFHAYEDQETYWETGDFARATYKAKYLRALTNKPLVLSETSVLVYNADDCNVGQYIQAKADYIGELPGIMRKADISAAVWYTAGGNGWNCSDLPADLIPLFWSLFEVE